jgi:hypothetical protein
MLLIWFIGWLRVDWLVEFGWIGWLDLVFFGCLYLHRGLGCSAVQT